MQNICLQSYQYPALPPHAWSSCLARLSYVTPLHRDNVKLSVKMFCYLSTHPVDDISRVGP